MWLLHILTHCVSLANTFAKDFLRFSIVVEIIEKKSIQHRLPTAHGSSLQILLRQGLIDAQEFDFLLRFPVKPSRVSHVSFLSAYAWGAIKVESRLLTCVI